MASRIPRPGARPTVPAPDEDDEFDLAPASSGLYAASGMVEPPEDEYGYSGAAAANALGDDDAMGGMYEHHPQAPSAAAAASSSSSSSSSSSAMVVSNNALSESLPAPIARPVLMTKHGYRQYVETDNGVRLFLQNCVATVDLQCHPDLAHVATHARNAEYNPRRFSAVILRLREPTKGTGLLFGTGKLCITGTKNEDDAKIVARKIAKIVQKLGFNAGFHDFRIQNMVATGDVGFPIRLEGIAEHHAKFSSYEPELFPGLIYRMELPRVVFLVFVSGKVCVTGSKTRGTLLEAMKKLFPVLYKFRKAPSAAAAAVAAAAAAESSSSGAAGAGVGNRASEAFAGVGGYGGGPLGAAEPDDDEELGVGYI